MQSDSITKMFETLFPFWQQLEDAQREQLCSHTAQKKVNKGENIHGGSGECTGAIVVVRGMLRAYMLSEDGREITLYRLEPGEICMLSASCVLQAITFDVFVDAEVDSLCLIINGKAFARLAEENVLVENFALQTAVERFSDVMWIMQQILFMSMDKRLAVFLYEEMNRTKEESIMLTKEQIARYMGSAREVVSRMLKYFKTEGIAEPVRGGVRILNKEKLRQLALQ